MAKLSEYYVIAIDRIDASVIPDPESPRVGHPREHADVASSAPSPRVDLKQGECAREPRLHVARKAPELALGARGEQDHERAQGATSKAEVVLDLAPRAALLSLKAPNVLEEELLGGVRGKKVVDQVVVGRPADLVSAEALKRLPLNRDRGRGALRSHRSNGVNGNN